MLGAEGDDLAQFCLGPRLQTTLQEPIRTAFVAPCLMIPVSAGGCRGLGAGENIDSLILGRW